MARLAARFVPGHTIHRIRYFTAHVIARSPGSQTSLRQQVYLRALRTLPGLSIHLGHYLSHAVRMPLADPPPSGLRTVEVIKTEEKGSDVNLATLLLLDAFQKDFEQALVISSDSDLRMPVEVVRRDLHLPVGVLLPRSKPSVVLRKAATFSRYVRDTDLAASQLPEAISDEHGVITKPARW